MTIDFAASTYTSVLEKEQSFSRLIDVFDTWSVYSVNAFASGASASGYAEKL